MPFQYCWNCFTKLEAPGRLTALMWRHFAGIDWGQEMQVKWTHAGEVGISHLLPGTLFSKWKNDIWGSAAAAAATAAERLFHTEVELVHLLTRSVFLSRLRTEPLHYWGREAVQSFSAQPLCRAPSGPGPPAAPRWGLDPVQGPGTGGTKEAERSLQEKIVAGTQLRAAVQSADLHWQWNNDKNYDFLVLKTVWKKNPKQVLMQKVLYSFSTFINQRPLFNRSSV